MTCEIGVAKGQDHGQWRVLQHMQMPEGERAGHQWRTYNAARLVGVQAAMGKGGTASSRWDHHFDPCSLGNDFFTLS